MTCGITQDISLCYHTGKAHYHQLHWYNIHGTDEGITCFVLMPKNYSNPASQNASAKNISSVCE